MTYLVNNTMLCSLVYKYGAPWLPQQGHAFPLYLRVVETFWWKWELLFSAIKCAHFRLKTSESPCQDVNAERSHWKNTPKTGDVICGNEKTNKQIFGVE